MKRKRRDLTGKNPTNNGEDGGRCNASGWFIRTSQQTTYSQQYHSAKVRGKQISVVYLDEVDGERVIDWASNPAPGALPVPRPCKSPEEWEVRLRRKHDSQ